MPTLDDLVRRVEHLLVRHAELQRTQRLLQQQVANLTAERDALRGRLQAARTRMDALLERLPTGASSGEHTDADEGAPEGGIDAGHAEAADQSLPQDAKRQGT